MCSYQFVHPSLLDVDVLIAICMYLQLLSGFPLSFFSSSWFQSRRPTRRKEPLPSTIRQIRTRTNATVQKKLCLLSTHTHLYFLSSSQRPDESTPPHTRGENNKKKINSQHNKPYIISSSINTHESLKKIRNHFWILIKINLKINN